MTKRWRAEGKGQDVEWVRNSGKRAGKSSYRTRLASNPVTPSSRTPRKRAKFAAPSQDTLQPSDPFLSFDFTKPKRVRYVSISTTVH